MCGPWVRTKTSCIPRWYCTTPRSSYFIHCYNWLRDQQYNFYVAAFKIVILKGYSHRFDKSFSCCEFSPLFLMCELLVPSVGPTHRGVVWEQNFPPVTFWPINPWLVCGKETPYDATSAWWITRAVTSPQHSVLHVDTNIFTKLTWQNPYHQTPRSSECSWFVIGSRGSSLGLTNDQSHRDLCSFPQTLQECSGAVSWNRWRLLPTSILPTIRGRQP